MDRLKEFIFFTARATLQGDRRYFVWLASLVFLMILGMFAFFLQASEGLQLTNMHDHVSWGLYIGNFTFIIGVAAGAVMLLIPRYVLHRKDFESAVLIGESLAVAALMMAMMFVTVDLGQPFRFWHLIPVIGFFNFPYSVLSWDMLVVSGYLALNLGIPGYLLYCRYHGMPPDERKYKPFIMLSIVWAFFIHLVTAFLLVAFPGKPWWNSALLGPRFLASAFAAGPAVIVVIFALLNKVSSYRVEQSAIRTLAKITMFAAYANLIMLFSELFVEFYFPSEHSAHAQYLFFGLHGHTQTVPFIWTAITVNVISTLMLSFSALRENPNTLLAACSGLFFAIWIEKSLGLIVPGFVPSPLGEIVEYQPSVTEAMITLGVLAMGALVFTLCVRTIISITNRAAQSTTSSE